MTLSESQLNDLTDLRRSVEAGFDPDCGCCKVEGYGLSLLDCVADELFELAGHVPWPVEVRLKGIATALRGHKVEFK